VRVIDKAKGPFDKDAFLQQVFDPHFTDTDRYATLLVERIPQGKRWDVLLEVYRRKEEGKGQKLKYFFQALLDTFSAEEIDQFCEIVSQELETTSSDAAIRAILQVLPSEFWSKYSEVARIRTEGKLIDAIRDGRYNRSTGKCLSGGFGTWASGLVSKFVLKDRLASTLAKKLDSSDQLEHAYVFTYFFPLYTDFPTPPPLLSLKLKQGLKAGDPRFRDALWGLENLEPTNAWVLALKKDLDSFVEAQEVRKSSVRGSRMMMYRCNRSDPLYCWRSERAG